MIYFVIALAVLVVVNFALLVWIGSATLKSDDGYDLRFKHVGMQFDGVKRHLRKHAEKIGVPYP